MLKLLSLMFLNNKKYLFAIELTLAALLLLIPSFLYAQISPEPSSGWNVKHPQVAKQYMVVTANEHASYAARDIIERGGNAIDAAIAAQLVLNVVEPQSSGIGGGGFLLYYDALHNKVKSFDGRETAPSKATPNMFLDQKGNPLPFFQAVRSGNAVGTPGLVALLAIVHSKYGSLSWKELFLPAIKIATEGFLISSRLHKAITYALKHPVSKDFRRLYVREDGSAKPIGQKLKNPQLANVFIQIAQHGPTYFYTGALAEKIADKVSQNDGKLTTGDLGNYKSKERTPACGFYRKYKVCGMNLPSSGGITLLQTLVILNHFELKTPYDTEEIHLILEAERRAFADRNYYLADSDHVKVPPINDLLDPEYINFRAKQIKKGSASKHVQPGNFSVNNGDNNSFDAPSTTHLSIVDKQGNAVSLTSSVEHNFGSAILVDGFVLNNQLTDFSFVAEKNGMPVANAVASGKRPRSSMSPTFIFKPDGSLYAVLGSPGGSSIIPYVRKTIIALLDWNMPLQEAINSPHFMHKNTLVALENGQEILAKELRKLGHKVFLSEQTSGVHAIIVNNNNTLMGAADPRREGMALGK